LHRPPYCSRQAGMARLNRDGCCRAPAAASPPAIHTPQQQQQQQPPPPPPGLGAVAAARGPPAPEAAAPVEAWGCSRCSSSSVAVWQGPAAAPGAC
jgi:hypothetical protein